MRLSSKGLSRVQTREFPSDSEFTFIVGGSKYPCSPFFADFLSPRIAQIHLIDPTVDTFTISTPDSKTDFSVFLALAMGRTVTFDSSELEFLTVVCQELGNEEVSELVFECVGGRFRPGFDRLNFRRTLGLDLRTDIEFIASNFGDFDFGNLDSLGLPLLHEILSSPGFRTTTEDSLCEFILRRDDYLELLEFVHFEFVSAHYVREILRIISGSFGLFSFEMWRSLSARLLRVPETGPRDIVICPIRKGHQMTGIIAYLTQKYGGNVHEKEIVNITASSIGDISGAHPPERVADLESGENFYTKGEAANAWICYDFRHSSVRLTHYSIRSYRAMTGFPHPRNWVIEGSNDGKTWVELDRREDNNDLNGNRLTMVFPVAHSEDVRMVRLRQHGPNHWQRYNLNIEAFELFGNLYICAQTEGSAAIPRK
jgi:hypothetical protein